MDYKELAKIFLSNWQNCRKNPDFRHFDENTKGEMFVLQCIAAKNSAVYPNEISDETLISSARVAITLNNLENKGYLERKIDKQDRRRVIISLTEKGAAKAAEHYERLLGQIALMLENLGETDAIEYVRLTKKAFGSMEVDNA